MLLPREFGSLKTLNWLVSKIIAKIAWKEDTYFRCFRQAENFMALVCQSNSRHYLIYFRKCDYDPTGQ